MTFQDWLLEMRACQRARYWVGRKTFLQAWKQCPDEDWMLWLVERTIWPRLALKTRHALVDAYSPSEVRKIIPLLRLRKAVEAEMKRAETLRALRR